MNDSITPTKLRDNIYNILDFILKTGIPVTVVRNGQKLIISPEVEKNKNSKLSNLKKRKIINGDPEDLVSIDWSNNWSELNK